MIGSIVLVGFGLTLAASGQWLVGRALRPEAAPTLGVVAWLATSAAALLSFGTGAARQQGRAELLMSNTFTFVDHPPF